MRKKPFYLAPSGRSRQTANVGSEMNKYLYGVVSGTSFAIVACAGVFVFSPIQVGLKAPHDLPPLSTPVRIEVFEMYDGSRFYLWNGHERSELEIRKQTNKVLSLDPKGHFIIHFPTSMSRFEVWNLPAKLGIPRKNILGYRNTSSQAPLREQAAVIK